MWTRIHNGYPVGWGRRMKRKAWLFLWLRAWPVLAEVRLPKVSVKSRWRWSLSTTDIWMLILRCRRNWIFLKRRFGTSWKIIFREAKWIFLSLMRTIQSRTSVWSIIRNWRPNIWNIWGRWRRILRWTTMSEYPHYPDIRKCWVWKSRPLTKRNSGRCCRGQLRRRRKDLLPPESGKERISGKICLVSWKACSPMWNILRSVLRKSLLFTGKNWKIK